MGNFDDVILPHLDAAYNLARWLVRNGHDAEDVVQDAYLRAFQYFGTFHGRNARAWLLTIVRNSCLRWLQKNRAQQPPPISTKTSIATHVKARLLKPC